jgi:outer membrane protein OmpA-like peptidoglycan-associated protein
MLSWITVHVEAGRIEHDLEQRARSVLHATGHDWASVVFSGRDGVLVGTARHPHEAADALALVRGVWGVRTVAGRTRIAGEGPDLVRSQKMAAAMHGRTLPTARPLAEVDNAAIQADTALNSDARPIALPTDAAADAQKSQAEPARAAIETAAIANDRARLADDCGVAVRTLSTGAPVRFARGEADLDGRGWAFLERLLAVASDCPQLNLRIAGYADADGAARHNLSLSKRRARVAVTYLLNKGIDAGRLEAVGYGEAQPVAPNDTAENRAKNRRIEVEVSEPGLRSQVSSPPTGQGAGNGLPDR